MLEELVKRSMNKDVFYILIGSVAIVGFWRGTWNLFDHFLFPGDFILSQIASITIGVIIILLLSQLKLKKVNKK